MQFFMFFFCLIQWQSIGYWFLHLPYGKWRRDELWTFLCKSCKFVFGPFLYILYQTSFCRPLFANLSNFVFYDSGLEDLKIWSNGANWSKTNLFWLFHARKAQKYPKSKKWLMSLKNSIFLGWNIECVD